jgi:hypothetical protein
MKVTKSAVYRITASTGCACLVTREYEDADYKKPLGEAEFAVCKKHKGQPGVDVIEMILTELVDKEAEDHKAAPAAPPSNARPNAAAVVNENGDLEMRVPIQRVTGRVTSVKPSGTTAAPAARPSAQAGRTGPAKAYVRPTAPARPAAPAGGLATALADDGAEDDLFSANDPDMQNAR